VLTLVKSELWDTPKGKFVTISAMTDTEHISPQQAERWRKVSGIHKLRLDGSPWSTHVFFQISDDLSDADLQKFFGTADKTELPEAAVKKLNQNML
jgi:hypothetical protein